MVDSELVRRLSLRVDHDKWDTSVSVPYGSLLLLLELLARHDYDFGLHDLASSLYVLLGGGPLGGHTQSHLLC